MNKKSDNFDAICAETAKAIAVDKRIKRRIVMILDGLLEIRGDMDGYQLTYLRIYLHSLLCFKSRNQAVKKIWEKVDELNSRSNDMPLYNEDVQYIIDQSDQKKYSYGSDATMVKKLNITSEEIKELGLLLKKRKAYVAANNNALRNKKRYLIRLLFREGLGQKAVSDMVNNILGLWDGPFECNVSYVKRYSTGARGKTALDDFPRAYEREKKSRNISYNVMLNNLTERNICIGDATLIRQDKPSTIDKAFFTTSPDTIDTAWDAYRSGSNLTVLGKAGTGKSTLIRRIVDDCNASGRKCVVSAPGGLAAHNAGGRTVCATYGLGHRGVYDRDQPVLVSVFDDIFDVDVLVIDEIGTLRADIGLQVIRKIQYIEETQHRKVQVVWLGDFMQMAPVCPEDEFKKLRSMGFESTWLFDLPEWRTIMGKKIILTHSYRQALDTMFEYMLDCIARGDKKAIYWINNNACRHIDPDAVYIVSKRAEARRLNQLMADKVNGVRRIFRTRDGELSLAVGMRVMTTANKRNLYQNGSLGWVSVLNDKSLRIKFDDGHEARVDALRDGTYPVALAYAITVHKAQGMTFDSINLMPGYFAAGQLYTAVSRVKSIKGIHLMADIQESDLKYSRRAYDFQYGGLVAA